MKLRDGGMRSASATALLSVAMLFGCGGDDAPETSEAAEYAATSGTADTGTPVTDASTASTAEPAADVTLEEALANDPNLTVFGRLIETARLEAELAREGELTLFVPNNAAFALVPEDRVAGEAAARELVLRHVASGSWDSGTLASRRSVRALNGSSITLHAADGALVVGEDAHVVSRDRRLGELTIHVISRVLGES